MDPTRKRQPPSITTTAPPPDPVPSSTLNKIRAHYPKGNQNRKPPPSALKSPDPPFVDTHLQARALTLSANADSSLLKKIHHHHRRHQQPKEKEKMKLKGAGIEEPKRPSVSLVSGGDDGRRRSFCGTQIELGEFFSSVGVRVVAVDMPPFMQIHAVSCARKAYDSLDKASSKNLACTLKKEFDGVYGPAWHCIVGTSFGSFVTHSVGGFFYFSIDHKLYILLFKTTVQRAD